MCEPIRTPDPSYLDTRGLAALLNRASAAWTQSLAQFSRGHSTRYRVAEVEGDTMQLPMGLKSDICHGLTMLWIWPLSRDLTRSYDRSLEQGLFSSPLLANSVAQSRLKG